MKTALPSSFKDPSGNVFTENDEIYRQINYSYQKNYDHLISSGLYADLIAKKWLIKHEECENSDSKCYKIIKPQQIPFISYPYEWCFSQLKDAALLTLSIQLEAIKKGMWLKDCSAYNIQFIGTNPVFIDTLSFEKIEGRNWQAYKQFCEHFLAPIILSYYKKENFNPLLKVYIDGISLQIVSKLLPFKSYFNIGTLLHIHLQSGMLKKSVQISEKNKSIKINQLERIIYNLIDLITNLNFSKTESHWSNYSIETNTAYFKSKSILFNSFISDLNPKSCVDFGANSDFFSKQFASKNYYSIILENDYNCVEQIYKTKNDKILSLVMDISNPSGGIGFATKERMSLIQRGSVDLGIALAFTHHLAIQYNIPFKNQAEFFASMCSNLIVEFVPKSDEKIQFMLKHREDIFENYTENEFELAFNSYFQIVEKQEIGNSGRILYKMLKRN